MNRCGIDAGPQALAKRHVAEHCCRFGEKQQVRFGGVLRHQDDQHVAHRLGVRSSPLHRRTRTATEKTSARRSSRPTCRNRSDPEAHAKDASAQRNPLLLRILYTMPTELNATFIWSPLYCPMAKVGKEKHRERPDYRVLDSSAIRLGDDLSAGHCRSCSLAARGVRPRSKPNPEGRASTPRATASVTRVPARQATLRERRIRWISFSLV